MDILGFAFGTIALVGPLASACLSAYGLLKDIKAIDEDAADFQLLVDAEMGLLSRWVKAWVHFDPQTDDTSMPDFAWPGNLHPSASRKIGEDNCLLVVRILAKISRTLGDTRVLRNTYGIEFAPIPSTGGDRKDSSSATGGAGPPLKKSSTPEVISVTVTPASSSSSTASPASPASHTPVAPVGVKQNSNHGLRSWLRRAGCHNLCSHNKKEEGLAPRQASVSDPPTGGQKSRKGKAPAAPPRSSPLFDFDMQMLGVGDNHAILEAAKRDIFDNLTKIQCLKWVLSDKEKGMALARELQRWNENLFKILPLPKLETPGE